VARSDRGESLSSSAFWLSQLPGGLPADFDYGSIKSVADVKRLILEIPNCDRGQAAVGLYRHHSVIGTAAAYVGIMLAWDHDHREIVDAFGSPDAFLAALRDIAPPLGAKLPRQFQAWRGILLSRRDPLRSCIGLSWTRDRSIACWFALQNYVPEIQPFVVPMVLHAAVERSIVVTLHNGRAEQELIVDARRLAHTTGRVTLDGFAARPIRLSRRIADTIERAALERQIIHWQLEAMRYQHRKTILELRRRSELAPRLE
jgi:hypothetical protein